MKKIKLVVLLSIIKKKFKTNFPNFFHFRMMEDGKLAFFFSFSFDQILAG